MTTLIDQFKNTKAASYKLAKYSEPEINALLKELAQTLRQDRSTLLEANAKDCARMDQEDPRYDRLLLTEDRIEAIAQDIENVAKLPSPLGKVLEENTRPNGLHIQRISVPLGVIGIIYEARPNVTFDVFSLCIKSGNACILKGGSDAKDSNAAGVAIIQKVLEKQGLPKELILLMPPEREAVKDLLEAREYVDILIPRGSRGLIDFVRGNAKVPVIETGAGIVHTYIDETADIKKATKIVVNAKTRRVSVCNALDTILIHQDQLPALKQICHGLAAKQVEVFADEKALQALKEHYPNHLLKPAKEDDFGTEFLSLKCSIKTVDSLDAALAHIQKYSSKHSEAIVSESPNNTARFLNEVDAAAVYANASTAFTDGAQFGLGAEIGISTQKLHARGPMGLRELTTYKWVVKGEGQTRV